ncbi:4'-phosphopantetheinyl transferase superfamily protein [Kitasatospora sp. NBC_00240]|uniref:4'-phosphopantetheinyl transferase superfamily protein n=1 Tax=Kitasatospora sp. NBC_00240 TaxID=2903567 RepID=UPI002250A0D4|nr:4'-phosphopantetheinyl transferase superfamily protein [Kitasatospora sp. NBC_00240]MCX5214398.1 4'-phosphopantetheinyl transferase superfamily protein [Kitasatospora sp. NBC_00240]
MGCDLELRLLPAGAAHFVLTPDEQEWTEEPADPAAAGHRLLTAFSAKEALFKAFSVLLPAPEAPTNLLGIAVVPVPGGFHGRPRRLPGPLLEVAVHPVGRRGVFSWAGA